MQFRQARLVSFCLAFAASNVDVEHAFAETFTVTTTADSLTDDGECSLREAVYAATRDVFVSDCGTGDEGLDLVQLPAGTYDLDLLGIDEDAGLTGDLDITGGLVIEGDGMGSSVIDASALNDRVFDFTGSLLVRDLTIQGGRAPSGPTGEPGGAFRGGVDSTLTVQSVSLRDNRAGDSSESRMDGSDGGAIWMDLNSTLFIYDSSIESNQAGHGGPSGDFWSDRPGAGGQGGAVALSSGCALHIERSSFTGNNSGEGGEGEWSSYGGRGGAISARALTSGWINETAFYGNRAGAGDSLPNHGGALSVDAVSTDLRIENSSFIANVAELGAAIFLITPATVSNCTFANNVATRRGGGISLADVSSTVTVDHSTFVDNVGGAVAPQSPGATIQVQSSILVRNLDDAGSTPLDCYQVLDGVVSSAGHNIFGSGTGCTSTADDVEVMAGAIDPIFTGELGDYGGPTMTLPISPAGLAHDSGLCTDLAAAPLTRDQRGVARPVEDCDIGSYELVTCAEGEYLGDTDCQSCSTCGEHEYIAAACSVDSDTTCEACNDVCGTCDGPSAAECTSCGDGRFLSSGICTSCSTCPEGYYAVSECTALSDTVCEPELLDASTPDASTPDASLEADAANDSGIVQADASAEVDAEIEDSGITGAPDSATTTGDAGPAPDSRVASYADGGGCAVSRRSQRASTYVWLACLGVAVARIRRRRAGV